MCVVCIHYYFALLVDNVRRPYPHHSQTILTPPNSQSDSQQPCTTLSLPLTTYSSPGDDEAEDNERMEFLRAYFYLEHHLRLSRPSSYNNELVEKDVVHQSVMSVLQHVDRNTPKERSDFPKCLDSFRVCVGLLDRHSKWSPPIREKFVELSLSWLQRLAEGDCVLKYYALLEILAESDGMAAQLAGTLVKSIAESQQRINEWEWDGMELIPRPVMSHFSVASYYFLLLEKTIPRMASADKSRFVTVLSHVEKRVHLNFPLFAASMMRLAHQLASWIEENVNVPAWLLLLFSLAVVCCNQFSICSLFLLFSLPCCLLIPQLIRIYVHNDSLCVMGLLHRTSFSSNFFSFYFHHQKEEEALELHHGVGCSFSGWGVR